MIGTIVSILAALFLWFHPFVPELNLNASGIETFMLVVAVAFLLLIPLGSMLAWLPLQKAEQNSTPHILEMLPKDRHLTFIGAYLTAFSLLTFLVVAISGMHSGHKISLLIIWLVLFGLACDGIRYFANRIMGYFNPFVVVQIYRHNAEASIRNERELDLCHWLDGLSEIAIKGIQRHSTSIAHDALSAEQMIARHFLEASKSIAHHAQDSQTKALGISDKVSFVLFYLYQRMDVVFEMALRNKLEMSCTHVITIFGKLSVDAAKFDITLASAPLRFLGKFAKRAQEHGFEESVMAASCVFAEVARIILKEIDITYLEIKDPFLSIINGMEQLAKGVFQRDKNTNIELLMQPFKDLKSLFQEGKAKEHRDTPDILIAINGVLGEFEALLMVMHTMPKLPEIVEEVIPPKQA